MTIPALRVRTYTLGPFDTNCYLVWPDGQTTAWVIDASWDAEQIAADAVSMGLVIERLILTHAHVDHIAGVESLLTAVARHGAAPRLCVHPLEQAWLSDPLLNLSELSGSPVTCRPADELLHDGQTLGLGQDTPLPLHVLHTPGHSPGSITIWCPSAAAVFVGDALMNGSVGRTDFSGSDARTLALSIRSKLYSLPRAATVLSGHGPPTSIGREMDTNPFVPSEPRAR